ncbi:hypothetical protein [Streptomyces griseus]|uniref:hypothetical protein n=1 Tax=Streptomyces griseus TaxID=1911 RepID=UPI003674F828
MIFILTGEKLMDADEDLAFESRRPYSGLGRKLERLSSLIDKSIHDIGESMPDDLATSYGRAMGMLVDDGGKNYLRDFAEQLDRIAEGRRKTSMDIMESKWQVIAEIIRLLIEIAIYLAMSFFTGGASASQIMMAKLRSRFFILTTLSHLLQRLHLTPSLTEAFAEAFTTFAVRLAMMNFAPDGRRPDGIDWSDIGKAAAFGAAAGLFTSVFDKFAKDIVRSFDGNFLKTGPDFKNNPNLRDTPDIDLKNNGPAPTPKPGPEATPGPDRPGPTPSGNGPTPPPGPPVTFRDGPLAFRNNPELWRNNQLLRHNADRPGALAGHYGLKGTADFLAAGSGEALAEILVKGAFDGDWSTSWSTFVGAGISSQVESSLTGTALNSGAELRHAMDKLRNQPPPTVSGAGDSGTRGSGDSSGSEGHDRSDGPARQDPTGGISPAHGGPPPAVPRTTGQGTLPGSEPPPSAVAPEPPPYVPVDPPPYSPGPMPVTAAENELWQQVHQGPGEAREQALRDLAALRGGLPPSSTETGVRDSLNAHLAHRPEVRVVPVGNSPSAQLDAEEVRRALGGFGTPATVDRPTGVDAPVPGGAGPAVGTGTEAPELTIVVSETPPPGAGSPEAAELLDGAGADRAVVLGPPVAPVASDVAGETGEPVRSAVELTRQGPGDPVQVRPLTGPGPDVVPGGTGETAFPDADVLLPLAAALGPPPVAPAPSPVGSAPMPATSAGPTPAVPVATTAPTPVPATSATPAPTTSATAPPGEKPAGRDGGAPAPGDPDPLPVRVLSSEPTPVTGPEGTADIEPTSSTATENPRTGHDTPAVFTPATPSGTWTGTATDLLLESGRADGTPPAPGTSTGNGGPATDQAPPGRPGTLRDFLPEDAWWRFYIDPKDHEAALAAFPDDPGSFYDHDRSPGFRAGMVAAYTRFLGDPDTVEAPMDASAYRTMHALATGHLGRTIGWSGDGTTQFPLRGDALAPDVFDERVGGRALVYDMTTHNWADPLPSPRPVTILTRFLHSNPALATNYTKAAAPGLVDALFQQHYARVGRPDADDAARLASIVRTVRALHVVHPFQDGNLRSNVQILLPRLLLEQGFRPVVPDTMYSLFQGGHSVPQMVDALVRDGALDTVRPRPAPAQDAVDPHLESGRGTIDTTGGGGPTPPEGRQPVVTTLSGHAVPFAQLRRWVPEGPHQPRPGRAVRTLTISQSPAEDGTGQSAGRRALLGQDTFRGVRTTSSEGAAPGAGETPPTPRTVFTGPPTALPGSGTKRGADYFAGHGTSRTVTLGTDDPAHPSVKISGVQLGEVLKSWAQDGDQDRPLVLFSCETGRQPQIAGLPVAQHVANRTGRPVYAPTTEAGTAKDRDGNVRAVLTEGPDGPGRWRLFTPEPGGAELDGLAREAGLHTGPDPADAFARARTLQQIRTLRDVLGTDAEQRPGGHESLAALAYVDGLRWVDQGTAARYGDGRMTPDLLRRMVIDRRGATGARTAGTEAAPARTATTTQNPSADPTPEEYREFLRSAARLRATAGPGTTLDALLPPPPPELPPTTPVSPQDVAGLAYAPAARITWSLSTAPLPLADLALSPEDTAELLRRRPDLAPAPSRPESLAEGLALFSKDPVTPGPANAVRADGLAFRRLRTPGGGDCLFRALLDSARSRPVPPAWAARNVTRLRELLRERLTGSELLASAAEANPDPVLAVVDDLRMTAIAGVRDPDALGRINRRWDLIAQAVVTDGDGRRWRRLLRDGGYPHLAEVAPTPADARRLGTDGLILAAAERPALWASPFADVLPQALAHILGLDLRLVQPDPRAPGSTFVTPLNPGGPGGALHLSYNGTDHFDALVPASALPAPASAPAPTSAPAPAPATEDPVGSDVFGQWLRSMGGVTDLDTPGTPAPDRGDPVPLETQLERHRPARLLTGEDARPPGPPPQTVTFDDGGRLPTVLISPDADPGDGGPGPRTAAAPRPGLLNGVGVLTLRSPDQVTREILGKLPGKLRAQFDEAELLRLLTDQPGAFTAPRGARFVGREKSGVGHEMTVEAIPYHRWERFFDVDGSTVRVDTMRRGQAGTGGGRSVGVGRRVAAALGMGPPLNWMLKIGVSLGWTRRTDYTLGIQAYHQSEYRAVDGSHLHLDDVHYQVRVERVTEAPKTTGPDTTSPAPAVPWRRTPVHAAAFAVRDGLSWRLPDDLTVPFSGPVRAPRTLTFPDGVEPRVSDTTALHLTDPPEEVALAISGARPGSSAHRTLISYVRPGRLHGLFGRFSGPVSGPELTRGSGRHPLGHLVVERSIPHRATLVTESVKAEVRDLAQTTYQNQRAHVRDTRFGVQVTAGPNHTLIGPETDVRLQGGPLVRADLSTGRGHYLGNDAARKVTGRVRNHPLALYRVERTLMVRGAGEPASAARPVRVVSLDWISTQDARRLAGWDSRTPGATGPNPDAEPPVPWYLTREDPVHLGGQIRAEGFRPDQRPPARPAGSRPARDGQPLPAPAPQDPLRAFADSVLDTLHRSYPSLFVPPLMLRHPRLAKLWYGDGRLRTALHNDRQVREALNRPSLAQSLDDLTTTGVPVTLTEDGKVRRGHHTLILRARLTDRRFETTMSERSLRNAVIGTEVSGQGQQASTTLSGGVELGISPRDHDKAPEAGLPRRTGNLSLGGRYARTDAKATRNTVAVAHDQLTFQSGADLYSYRVELGATFEGHRRPRGWARLASVGLLGAGLFVSKVEERPLFSRGTETVGRVELAVPAAHGSDRYAPTDPPATDPPATGPAAATSTAPAPTPAPRPLSATEADQLLDGTRPLPHGQPSDRQLVRRLLSAPHVVLSAEGGRQRQRLVQDTADRASGTSWHVSAPGAPIRTALRRAMADLSIAGQLGQYLGPFGSRITGLSGAGPLATHYLKAAVRGELGNVRVMSDPKPGSLEATIGNEHRVAGTSSTVSRTTLGLQGATMPLQQAPGEQAVVGSYATALQYAWGKGRSASQTLTRGRNTTLAYAGRMYLVVADAVETVAVRDRWTAAMGAVGTRPGAGIGAATGRISERLGRKLAPRRAAAALQRVRDAVMFHLPMQDAIEAGLAPDGLGATTPDNLGGGYRLPPFLRGRRFPSHPSGQLDAGPAAQRLMGQLERIGVPSHDREQVLQRLSPDFLRSHLHELTTDGMTLPVRYRAWSRPHHLPVGGSPGQLRFTLTPVTTTVQRLRTGYELEDYRTTARDDAAGTTQDRGADVTLSASQRAAGSGVLVANPALQGTAARQRSSARTETAGSTAMPNIATTQTHAEIVTSYTLTVTMTDASGEPLGPTATAPVGSLGEILPTSLLTPEGDGAAGALTEQEIPEPERAVTLLTADQARPEAIAKWRRPTVGETGAPDPDVLLVDDRIGSGILAVDVLGAVNVHDALTLATARADGSPGDSDLGRRHSGAVLAERVRMARHTPLTGLGTAPAEAQREAAGQVGLTAGFREALGAEGSPLPTQASAHLFGQSHTADSRLYARMHRRGARLLAVENKPRMEAMRRRKASDALESGIVDNVEGAVSSSPMAGNSNAGVTNPGATVPIGGANDGTTLKGATDTTLGTHVKVVTDRSMLFAIPVSWLSVAEVDHRFTDSRPARALGKPRRGPRAAEAETTALVWLREDIARDHGLLDDTTFPDEARTAWDDQAKAAADLAAAEKNYYDARARAREAWLDLSADERAALGDGHPDLATVLPRSMDRSPAVAAWRTAREEVRRWRRHTDTAAADHHRLHLAATRLTAHHQGSVSAEVKDPPQEYTAPDWRSEAPEPYTITDATDSAPRTLTSPDGATVRDVHAVPHDGASFFHALLAVARDRGRLPHLLGTDLAERFAARPADPEVTAEAVAAARDRLAWALADHGNEDLLDALALDAADTFTRDELDLSGVRLTAAQQAEFDAFGRLPQTFWPTPEQRVALAVAALSRPFAAEPSAADATDRDAGETAPPERRAGDHGGADLLPALAARVLGTPLTVVTGEGRQQVFLPHGADPAAVDAATDPVLLAEQGFFHATLPAGTPPPVATPLPTPTTTSAAGGSTTGAVATGTATPPAKPLTHRGHTTAPWLPPADATVPRYRLDRDGVLTAPDGATYTQGAPTGRGNGFFGALSTALRQAAAQPGPDRREASRLRTRADASPALLMRLNGLPGKPAERDALFAPPPLPARPGVPEPSRDARDGHLRRHLAEAPWGPDADRAVAEWAAAATGATVTLVEENGTVHTYAGPSPDAPTLRLRRRGGDLVPLLPRTPAPAPKAGSPARPDPADVPRPPSPTGSGLPAPPDDEEAYELSTFSGAEPPSPDRAIHPGDGDGGRGPDSEDGDAESEDGDTDSEDEVTPPAWADPRWLSTVFGPQWSRAPRSRLQETSEALYALVERAAGGRPLRAGLTGLTHEVLHLPRRTRVSPQDVLDLGALALEASSDDLESAEDLAAYFIDRQIETRRDALAEETLLHTEDRSPAGRDFTGTGHRPPEPDSYLAERSGAVDRQPAPWRGPYVIVAEEADGGGVEIVTPWRTFVVRDPVEMARIISYDSRRPRGADIVLVLPETFAAQVANLVSGTTARPTWYPRRPVEVADHPTTGERRLVVHRSPGETGPDWAAPPPPRDPGLTGARDLTSDSDPGGDSESDSDSTDDGDAEFDRLADLAQWERRIDALRPRPLITRDYRVVDESGTGVLFTELHPRAVGEVRAGDGPDAPALILPHQDQGFVHTTDRPPLHISEDRTLALHSAGDDTTGRGRQVYATRAAIERSAALLAATGAGVRLTVDTSVRLLLPREDGSTGEPLFRVEARFLTASGASEHAFTRDFARTVAGADAPPLSHLAFRGPDGTAATAPVNGLHGREVTGTHHLAQALTEAARGVRPAAGVTPDWAARRAGSDPRFTGGVVGAPTPGEPYGRALSHTPDNTLRGPLNAAAARTGVNQFAWAEVGEGYLIQSVSTTNDGGAQLFTHNHAKPGAPAGPHAPYHFAQVVLASEDGAHQITLENATHSRADLPADRLDDIVDDNLDRYDADELGRLARETDRRAEEARRGGAEAAEIVRLEGFAHAARALAGVHEAEQVRWYFAEDRPEHATAQREVDRARARARDAVRAAAPVTDDRDLWFFRAYSRRPGESAHAVNAALLSEGPSAVSNPLTTVVLHGHTPRPHQRTLRFAEQRHNPASDQDENLDALALSLARAGLWNRANGLPLPTITVTGHGNRSRASGRKRAEAVTGALGDRLGRLLRTFQEGAPGPHVTLSDFRLTQDAKRVRGATDPDRGRVVTVDIDDRRRTPAPSLHRPEPLGEPTEPGTPAPPRPASGPAPATGSPTEPPGSAGSAPGRAGSRTPRRSVGTSPDRGVEVPAWVRARIRYAEESLAFERRLADHLAENEAVTEEFRKMARAAWERARQQFPRHLATFGSENPSLAGSVGTARPALQQVLRSGNLRELVTFLFQGISSDLVPEMLGGREDQHPEIEAERPSRRQAEGRAELERLAEELRLDDRLTAQEKQAALARATRAHLVRTRPDDVRPPLSRAERLLAVDDQGLTWMPATSVYDLAMSSGFQGASEDSGGLVATGTAGSTYRFLVHAARMRDRWGIDLDLGLIRAGMIATSMSAGHHSFHEVMRGAQLALDGLPGHDPALDYQDNWGRYWNVYPLTERELRDHVARDGLFPDEHARALLDTR